MTLDDYAALGRRDTPLLPGSQRAFDAGVRLQDGLRGLAYEAAARAAIAADRAQFAPTARPTLWERLKRWWFS